MTHPLFYGNTAFPSARLLYSPCKHHRESHTFRVQEIFVDLIEVMPGKVVHRAEIDKTCIQSSGSQKTVQSLPHTGPSLQKSSRELLREAQSHVPPRNTLPLPTKYEPLILWSISLKREPSLRNSATFVKTANPYCQIQT